MYCSYSFDNFFSVPAWWISKDCVCEIVVFPKLIRLFYYSSCYNRDGIVVKWLALSTHSNRVWGLAPLTSWGCVCGVCCHSRFLQKYSVGLISDSCPKVWMWACLIIVGLVIEWQPVQYLTSPSPRHRLQTRHDLEVVNKMDKCCYISSSGECSLCSNFNVEKICLTFAYSSPCLFHTASFTTFSFTYICFIYCCLIQISWWD